ncbi:MAG: DUF2971 domain-containing protein [Alphaproteobacteria bacterium]|nr:DUF2971 domain-containing protein [Alphaproteobacteria bacterium]
MFCLDKHENTLSLRYKMNSKEDFTKLENILFPFYVERRNLVQKNNTRFVHYTTAECATSIIRNKEIWMREASCMNDFMEVEHGLGCLRTAYNKKEADEKTFAKNGLKLALDEIYPNFSEEVQNFFNGWQSELKYGTYLSCFSEHKNAEDINGRLSMWRAYGGKNGVAIVIKNHAFLSAEDNSPIAASPVEYLNDENFSLRLNKIAENIRDEKIFLRGFNKQHLVGYIFNSLKYASICTKHPGFKEELEWRLLYTPKIDGETRHIKKSVECINSTPQTVYRVPLKNNLFINLFNIEVPQLLDRVIIGPTEFPLAIKKAFVDILKNAGIREPEEKIYISDIPLRS